MVGVRPDAEEANGKNTQTLPRYRGFCTEAQEHKA